MKATFFLPAHPSYFSGKDYSQDDIENGLANTFLAEYLKSPQPLGPVECDLVLVREPGQFIGVKTGAESEPWKPILQETFNGMRETIASFIESGRGNYQKGIDPRHN